MIQQSATLDDVAKQAAIIVGAPPREVVELFPHGTVRSFRAGKLVVRIDEDPIGRALDVEARVLDALASAATPPLAPPVAARGRVRVAGAVDGVTDRPFLAYPWIEGRTLEGSSARSRAREVGGAFARLHGTRVMDLFGRLPRERPLTLLESFRKSVEDLKAWMAARELDGLGQDLLTLALSDLQRALRPFCIAQDHLFLTARRRVLCHGRASPSFIVVRADAPPAPPPLCFVGLEGACLGDAADDLATFSLAAGLDEHAEDALLRAYVEGLDREGRLDRRFIPRYFARRTLGLFAQPVARLDAMARMKRGDVAVLGDPVVVIEEQARVAYEELARAMNGLRDLGGRARAVGVAEVMSMGRILAVEEMILADRAFRIAVTGQPYVGKTEVAARLAKRLKHRFYGTAALSRALALVERDALAPSAAVRHGSSSSPVPASAAGGSQAPVPSSMPALVASLASSLSLSSPRAAPASTPSVGGASAATPSGATASGASASARGAASTEGAAEPLKPRALVERLFARGFRLEPKIEPPFYTAFLDGRDVTEELREGGPLHIRGAQLLDDDVMRAAIRDELLRRSATEGIVVEGAFAQSLVAGRAHVFHLSADAGVRRARLFSHRPDVGSEEEAQKLLTKLDEGTAVPAEATQVDVGSRTAAAATLEILWHLLPAGRRPQEDLSGRAPL